MNYNFTRRVIGLIGIAGLLSSLEVRVQAQIITTIAGAGTHGLGDGGPADSSQFIANSVTVDSAGNIYIPDIQHYLIRKIDAVTGNINTIAGNGNIGSSGDGNPAISASFSDPFGIALDDSGNIYISDFDNNSVRKITALSGIIDRVAGNGHTGYSGDDSLADSAELNSPMGICISKSRNIYIADWANNRVRKVTASNGLITTFAGTGAPSTSGTGKPADSANVGFPVSVAIDDYNNVYLTTETCPCVLKIDGTTGIVSVVAGGGTNGLGDGGPADSAMLSSPGGIAVDKLGNLYIADFGNKRIRKVSASTGIITTVAGNGSALDSGDGGPADSAGIRHPGWVAVDGAGNIYIADDTLIRKVTAYPSAISSISDDIRINISPNPANDVLYISLFGNTSKGQIILSDINGRIIKTQGIESDKEKVDITTLSAGIYLAQIRMANGLLIRKFVKE